MRCCFEYLFLKALYYEINILRRVMYKGMHVAVVIPAKDEEEHIGNVLSTIPEFVDRVVVVDDGS